jgi:hypothetical protein
MKYSFFDPNMDTESKNAIVNAIGQWNSKSSATGVFLEEASSSDIEFKLSSDNADHGGCAAFRLSSGRVFYSAAWETRANNSEADGATVMAHEIGHYLALDDAGVNPVIPTIMNNPSSSNCVTATVPTTSVLQSDAVKSGQCIAAVRPTPTPSPTPSPTPDEEQTCYDNFGFWIGGTCQYSANPGCEPGQWGFTNSSSDCQGGWYSGCECLRLSDSPILIDVSGNGFSLTGASEGVYFDMDGSGAPKKFAWTTPSSDDAWLALDRNGNGAIDNGRELFGNYTPQPAPPDGEAANGFRALAEFDKPQNGGNADGLITAHDAIFSSLRLWLDTNHNGMSESSELFSLPALGLKVVELEYQTMRKIDQFGNAFRYRAKVKDYQGSQLGRWAWDVFLVRDSN